MQLIYGAISSIINSHKMYKRCAEMLTKSELDLKYSDPRRLESSRDLSHPPDPEIYCCDSIALVWIKDLIQYTEDG